MLRPLPDRFDETVIRIRRENRLVADWDLEDIIEDLKMVDFQLSQSYKKKKKLNKGNRNNKFSKKPKKFQKNKKKGKFSKKNESWKKKKGYETKNEKVLYCKYCEVDNHNSTNCSNRKKKQKYFAKNRKKQFAEKDYSSSDSDSESSDEDKSSTDSDSNNYDSSDDDEEVNFVSSKKSKKKGSKSRRNYYRFDSDEGYQGGSEDYHRGKYRNRSSRSEYCEETGYSADRTKEDEQKFLKNKGVKRIFCVDSGATVHVVNSCKYLLNKQECKTKVHLVDGSTVVSNLRGNLSLNLQKRRTLTLYGVLFIPNSVNLISVRRLVKQRFSVTMDKDFLSIMSPLGSTVIKSKTAEDKNWELECSMIKLKRKVRKKATIQQILDAHLILGHPSYSELQDYFNNYTDLYVSFKDFFCIGCVKGKTPQKKIPKISRSFFPKTTKPLKVFYLDCAGPITPKSYNKETGFLLITDGNCNNRWFRTYSKKTRIPELLIETLLSVMNEFEITIRRLHSDRGSEFNNQRINQFCKKNGILTSWSTPGRPQKNGKAERSIRTVINRARSLLYSSNMPRSYWNFAVSHAVTLLNATTNSKIDNGTTPYEIIHKKTFPYEKLKFFGVKAEAVNHVKRKKSKKLDSRTQECIVLTYNVKSDDYTVMWRPNNILGTTDTVKVNNNHFRKQFNAKNCPDNPIFKLHEDEIVKFDKESTFFISKFPILYKPKSFYDIKYCKEENKWRESYYAELNSLETIGKFKVIEAPADVDILSLVELFDIKYDAITGKLKYKVRFAVRGDLELQQSYSTYSPVKGQLIVRLTFAIVAIFGYLPI